LKRETGKGKGELRGGDWEVERICRRIKACGIEARNFSFPRGEKIEVQREGEKIGHKKKWVECSLSKSPTSRKKQVLYGAKEHRGKKNIKKLKTIDFRGEHQKGRLLKGKRASRYSRVYLLNGFQVGLSWIPKKREQQHQLMRRKALLG